MTGGKKRKEFSEETKAKMSASAKARWEKYDLEHPYPNCKACGKVCNYRGCSYCSIQCHNYATKVGYKHTPEAKEKSAAANRGLKRTPEHIEIIRKTHTGKTVSEETRKKLSEAAKATLAKNGGVSPNKGKKYGPSPRRGVKLSEERKATLYKLPPMYGKDNPRYGKTPPPSSKGGKKSIAKDGKTVRSSWELAFSNWLHDSGVEYEYEGALMDFGTCTYTPDYYLPELGVYVELKGYERDNDYEKVMRCLMAGYRIVYILGTEWKQIDWSGPVDQILKWELGRHSPTMPSEAEARGAF